MSDPSEKPWSNHSYAPQIPYSQYFSEKATLAGDFISAIFYGIIIVLFFRCMDALLSATNHMGRGVKWWLVAHTATMFSIITTFVVTSIAMDPVCYIDNREFPSVNGAPGPYGYFMNILYYKPINVIPNTMFLLNNWLADGILLYRCLIIYDKNYWVIVLPCMMYLASIGMGATFTYVQPDDNRPETSVAIHNFGISYFSISLSLNVLLTSLIIGRLVLHNRRTRKATGTPIGIYKTIVTMLVESFALHAGSFLLFIGTWGPGGTIEYIFYPTLAATQVIAPFLIILRAANRRTLTSETVLSGIGSSLRFGSQGESTVGGGSLLGGSNRGIRF